MKNSQLNLNLEIKESYPLSPDNPYEVRAIVAGVLGFPLNYHCQLWEGHSTKGRDIMRFFDTNLYMRWSTNDIYVAGLFKIGNLLFFVDKEDDRISFWYSSKDTNARRKMQEIISLIEENYLVKNEPPERERIANISLLLSNPLSGELTEVHRTMYSWEKKTETELRLIYDYDKFVEFVDFMQNGVGLSILQGIPGTGKTSIIRDAVAYMADEDDPTEVVYLTADNLHAIGSEQFIQYFVKHPGRALICEDAEPVLQKTLGGIRSKSTSNLLNLSDGILSDISSTSIVATLNCDMEAIDEALIRPGRCDLIWTVEPMTEDKAYRYWEYRYSQEPDDFKAPVKGQGAMTLAQFNQVASK